MAPRLRASTPDYTTAAEPFQPLLPRVRTGRDPGARDARPRGSPVAGNSVGDRLDSHESALGCRSGGGKPCLDLPRGECYNPAVVGSGLHGWLAGRAPAGATR